MQGFIPTRRAFLRTTAFGTTGAVAASTLSLIFSNQVSGALPSSVAGRPEEAVGAASFNTMFAELWDRIADCTLEYAAAMPETQYDFKPVPEVRSFKEQMLHIADSDFWIGYLASGEETGTDYSAEGKSKANVIELLETSFSHMSQLIRALSDDQLRTTVQTFEGERDRMEVLYLMRDHVTHHRGQSVVYLRLQGIIPPDWVGS